MLGARTAPTPSTVDRRERDKYPSTSYWRRSEQRQLTRQRFRFSALAVTTAAIVPLLPGRAVYRGLFEIVNGENGSGLYQGLGTLLGAVGVGMGLAAGVSLGTYAARLATQTAYTLADRLTRS